MLRYITVSKVNKNNTSKENRNNTSKENRQNVATTRKNASIIKRNVLTKNSNVLTENRNNVSTVNRNVLKSNENVFTENRNVFTSNKNVLTENRNVPTVNRNVLTSNKNVFTENRNVLTSNKNVVTENRNNVLTENKALLGFITNRKCTCHGCRNGDVCSEKENKKNNCSPPTYLKVENKLHSLEFTHVVHSIWSEKFYTPYLDFKMSFQSPCCRNPNSCISLHQKFGTVEVPYGQTKIFHFLLEEQLWDKAFEFFMYIVSDSMYPNSESFLRVLEFIYYTNDVKLRNIAGRIVRHVIESHPPCAPNMRLFYLNAITSTVSKSFSRECDGIFQLVLSELEHMLSYIDPDSYGVFYISKYTSCANDMNDNTFISCCKGDEEHLSHLCFLLKLLLEIVECDLVVHLAKNECMTMKKNSLKNPLAVSLLWIPSFSLRDSIILQLKCFVKMYASSVHFNTVLEISAILSRLIAITAEVGRVFDTNTYNSYPQFNFTTEELAKEVALSFIDISPAVLTKALYQLSPNWLLMLVTNYLLTNMKKLDEMSPSLEILVDHLKINDGPHDQEVIKPLCDSKKPRCAKILNVNKRNHLGETRLHIVCRLNKLDELTELLSCSNIDINIQDNYGWTPLHNAIKYGNKGCVMQILNHKSSKHSVNLHAKSHNGITPFLDAVLSDDIEICNLLLHYGGYTLLEDKTVDGKKAIVMAQSIKMHKFLEQCEELLANTENLKFDNQIRYSNFETTFIPLSHSVLEIFACAYVKVYRLESLLRYFYKDVSVFEDSSRLKKRNISNAMLIKAKFDMKHMLTLNSFLMQKESAKQIPGLAFVFNKVLFYK